MTANPWRLPPGWRWAPFGDVAKAVTNQVNPSDHPDETPYVGLENMEADTGLVAPSTLGDAGVTSAKHTFEADHILYGKLRPYLNKVAQPGVAGLCSTDIIPVAAGDDITADYLAAWMRSPEFVRRTKQVTAGANLPRIGVRAMEQLPVAVAPAEHQSWVAQQQTRISDAHERIRRTRDQIDELERSLYLAHVGPAHQDWSDWPRKTIAHLAEDAPGSMRTGPFGSSLRHSEFVDDGIAVLGIDNAVNNRFSWGERRFITAEKYEELRRYTVKGGDVIITIMGTCGRVAVVPEDIPTAVSTKHLATITLARDTALPEYVHGSIRFDPYVRRQMELRSRGAIMDGLNLTIIKSLELAVPPHDAQKTFARRIALLEQAQRQLSDMEERARELAVALTPRFFGLTAP